MLDKAREKIIKYLILFGIRVRVRLVEVIEVLAKRAL